MIRGSDSPATRAASTYSSPRTAMIDARTRRKTPGAMTTPKTSIASSVLRPNWASTTSRMMIAGWAITRLATQLAAASKRPR
ncbi:unannotated protein [freshwater metagenome]|uniref:Unannotated protein n=1 Tax=freshwater metagenome TaxID=449393 RepID=A0A6J7J0B1_9ZZZZ